MATEIELKAHVRDYEALKLILCEKAKFLGTFEKEDSYWYAAESAASNKEFRLRKEKRIVDGVEKFTSFISYKKKEVRDQIEINKEREFEVNQSEMLEEFLSELGLKPRISKRKRGWAYNWEGITAELAEVEGLGWFIELEILSDSECGVSFEEAKKRLMDLLFNLGIEENAIESRYYTDMLLSM